MMTTFPLIAMLIAIMIATTLFRFTLYKVQGYVQIAYFVLVIVVVTLVAFGFPDAHL